MAYMVQYNQTGLNQAQYDEIRKLADWEAHPPEGSLFHVVGFKDGMMHATDIWENLRDRDAYHTQRLNPAIAKVGVVIKDPDIVEIHVMAASAALDSYVLKATIPS
jgi:hypothetical protein